MSLKYFIMKRIHFDLKSDDARQTKKLRIYCRTTVGTVDAHRRQRSANRRPGTNLFIFRVGGNRDSNGYNLHIHNFIPNANGAIFSGTRQRCTSSEYAFVNYLQYEISPRWLVIYRNGFMDDFEGQRIGYKTPYDETTLSTTYWVGEAIEIRAEVTYERSFDVKAYDANNAAGNGRSRSQLTFPGDMMFHYGVPRGLDFARGGQALLPGYGLETMWFRCLLHGRSEGRCLSN